MTRVYLIFISLIVLVQVTVSDTVIEGPGVTDLPKYSPSLLSTIPLTGGGANLTRSDAATTSTNKTTNTITNTTKRIRECQANCTTDSDCRRGLLCSKEHRKELRSAGFNVHKVYCTVDREKLRATNTTLASQFVCYNPKNLNTTITTSAPKKTPVSPPVPSPTNYTTPPPQCPDPTIKDADYCDYFALPQCIIGSSTQKCYRTIRKTLPNGTYTCKNDEKCYYKKQCRCNSKFGWMCQTLQSVLSSSPKLVESSKCQNNPPRAPAAAPVTKVVPVPKAPTTIKPKECNTPIPEPGSICSSTTDSTCVANQVCCRSLKQTLSDGTKLCNPKTCTYSYGCNCDNDLQQWNCWTAKIGCIDDSECSN